MPFGAEECVMDRRMPFIQGAATEFARVHLQDDGETRKLAEFRSSAAGLPMAASSGADVGNRRKTHFD